jgi:hypothetical protein
MTVTPALLAVLTTARITAFRPGRHRRRENANFSDGRHVARIGSAAARIADVTISFLQSTAKATVRGYRCQQTRRASIASKAPFAHNKGEEEHDKSAAVQFQVGSVRACRSGEAASQPVR